MSDLEITPAEAKARLERGEGVLLVDVANRGNLSFAASTARN